MVTYWYIVLFSFCIFLSFLPMGLMFSSTMLSFRYKKVTSRLVNVLMANEGKSKGKRGGATGGSGSVDNKRQFASNRGSVTTASSGNPIRVSRIGRALRDELSSIICEGDIKANAYPDDELLRSTTVCDVDVSSDLSSATIYVSVLGNSVEKVSVTI